MERRSLKVAASLLAAAISASACGDGAERAEPNGAASRGDAAILPTPTPPVPSRASAKALDALRYQRIGVVPADPSVERPTFSAADAMAKGRRDVFGEKVGTLASESLVRYSSAVGAGAPQAVAADGSRPASVGGLVRDKNRLAWMFIFDGAEIPVSGQDGTTDGATSYTDSVVIFLDANSGEFIYSSTLNGYKSATD